MVVWSILLYTYYILDFGSESLKVFEDSPLVGNVLVSSDKDKIVNLFKMLINKIEERKKLFTSFGGSYDYYLSHSDKKLPAIVVIINNFEVYSDSYFTNS